MRMILSKAEIKEAIRDYVENKTGLTVGGEGLLIDSDGKTITTVYEAEIYIEYPPKRKASK